VCVTAITTECHLQNIIELCCVCLLCVN